MLRIVGYAMMTNLTDDGKRAEGIQFVPSIELD